MSKKRAVRIEFDDLIMDDLELLCDNYGYTKTGLIRTISKKCIASIKKTSLSNVFKKLDNIDDRKWEKMI